MTQVTWKVAQLNGANNVVFDHENEARDWAARQQAIGVSVYLLKQTSEFISLFDAKENLIDDENEADQCDCNDRSWYGDWHDSACPLAGKPR